MKIAQSPWFKILLCLAAGALLVASCADFDIWPLAWVGMVPLLWVVLDPQTKHPARYGFVSGLVANGGGFYWLLGFLQRFAHLPLVAALPLFFLLIAYQASGFALFAWLLRHLRDRLGLDVIWLAPCCWVAMETALPQVFPWHLSITQAWVRPVIQIAELTGPLGVSLLLVLSNSLLWRLLAARKSPQKMPRLAVGTAIVVLAGNVVFGFVRIAQVERARAAAPTIKVGIVQANIGVQQKWQPDLAEGQLAIHQRLSAELEHDGAELIVWPETSYPFLFPRDRTQDWPEDDPCRIRNGFTAPLLVGSLTRGAGEPFPYNSALLLDSAGEVRGRFDKNILLVFGESIPCYEQMKWLKEVIPETAHWQAGTDVAALPLAHRGHTYRIGPMICYEDIFPAFGRRLAAKRPNLLINLTNDAWFGRTSEPYEHLALAVYRSVEMRLDLVRAVNTGVSALIDSTGRVVAKTRSVDPAAQQNPGRFILLREAALQEPQTLYSKLGEWLGGLCLLLVLILLERARARAGTPLAWRLVAWSMLGVASGILASLLVFAGPARVTLGLALLARTTPADLDPQLAYHTGLCLLPGVFAGSLLAGWLVRRAAACRATGRTELALGIVALMLIPALLFGHLEGRQAAVIAGAVLAVLPGLAATRLLDKFRR